MAVPPTTNWVVIDDRRIKIYEDEKTQSVNICTPSNSEGNYEQVFFFPNSNRVEVSAFDRYSNLEAVVRWLRKRSYDQLQ